MSSSPQDLSKNYNRLFHISQDAGIGVFSPRPAPVHSDAIKGDVVFAVSEPMLHNYLLPRDCPRVSWYAGANTTDADKMRFLAGTEADYIITVESRWYRRIKETTLYCYEFPGENFILLDQCAGYFISYDPVAWRSLMPVYDIMAALLARNVELRFTPSLNQLAAEVAASTLNFSLIRMRNAQI